ncbi:hypothetical protein P170DRAFT_479914 [Aspergillus steynii IBT 23096]|uniref:Zn(2)-C6 fungal-type domain-containing protein n=1 Tax=Aspergillus steynii IBT 23096 TaxID=1392250 RepID=A0A2I2FU25_9EURO|nr:uncharacterized protein P170DRAFT_479914 [Aspergillus steynii IBT 23096]PLB44143.1 hypothetical protein P170DRAFT_479914 [Aspergillus steynii IBT 23096]
MLRRTRRAPKACSWCHHRKVRCDASIRGCPCARCRQDGRPECVLRGRLPRNFSGFAITDDDAGYLGADPISRTISAGHVIFSSYPFVELRGEKYLDKDDLAYLAAKGCLSVPDKTLIEDFLRGYFLHIHPYVPILDEAEVWDLYRQRDEDDSSRRMSLLLFQAILFASCPYVSVEIIRKCGFQDKRSARNAFYNRAKILLDLKGDDRPLVQAQGAVLLSLHTSADEPQAGSLWLTRAIQAAMLVGYKAGPYEDVEVSIKKRLWWSIILRDRSLCLGLRRRPQVTSIDMGMGIEPLEEEDFAQEINRSLVYRANTKRLLFKALQEQCRLAVLLTEMVSCVFASHGLSAPSLSLDEFKESLTNIGRIKESMQQWEICSKISTWLEDDLPESVTLFVNFTLMYYQTARIDLAHYEALLIENHVFFAGHDYISQLVDTGTTLHDAMNSLTSIMEYFSREGRAQSLPLSVLAYVAMPLVLSAIDLKLSSSSADLQTRRRRLDALGEIVRHSGQIYDVTDCVRSGTNHILQLAYITAQHLFLRWDRDSSSPSTQSCARSETAVDADLIEASAQPYVARRAKNWYDAFLQCPRAYLLISTSVDYSLAVGRLPGDGCLPELVRSIPPIGVGIRLPWTVDVRETAKPLVKSGATCDADGGSERDHVSHAVSGKTDQSGTEDQVNLDYFHMDVISISSSSPSPDGMSDIGASANPDEQGAQDEAVPDFDADLDFNMEEWQLDNDDDIFDPVIASMVQDYLGGSPEMAGETTVVDS